MMDMEFSERFLSYLMSKKDVHGWQKSFADATGITQTALSKILSGDSTNPTLKTISKIMDYVGPQAFYPEAYMSRTGKHSPKEVVQGDGLPSVPVYGSTGAGPDVELFSGEPETFIQVLPQYMLPDLAAFRVDGDSMEPTIKCGSYVGVVPFGGDIAEGGIYLVSIPPFGRLIKRLKMGDNGGITLVSDNKKYKEKTIPYEGYDKVVLGRVAWVWQLF